ncbi:MAG: hypothetical protein PHH98_05060 [Candidatus Gracilibacteria bacterium]|nr:hypothetical protein [Candidatus Gracilibacteria bacterium]
MIFLWLVSNTFGNQNYVSFDKVFYTNNETGLHGLEIKNDELIFNSGSNSTGGLDINYINQFDKILNYKGKINISNDKTKKISLEKGIFLINFSELNSEYNIVGEGFSINTKGPSTFFLDNSGSRTTVFSINSNIELKLINTETNRVVNTVYLFPHNYIKIIPSQNKNVENADLLKLIQRFPLEFFNERIIIDGEINQNIIDKITGKKEDIESENIKNMFKFLYLNNNIQEKYLSEFKSSKFGFLLGEKFIKQYNKYFLNETKKSIYYKNLILRSIGDIISSKEIDNSKNNFLIESLNELKTINQNDYIEMKNIFDFYSNLVINGGKNEIGAKINFSKIYNKLENKNYNFENDYLIALGNLYFKYDFNDYKDIYLDLNTINQKIIENKLNEIEKSYFIFFLNKSILAGFQEISNNPNIKLENILNIFNDYYNISIDYYSIDDNIRVRTGIENYNEILKKLAIKIGETYFEKERNEQNLLILNKKNLISSEKGKLLEKNINSIYNFFNKNSVELGDRTKDQLIKDEFSSSKKLFNEYLMAIEDYNTYTANYNDQNKNLLYGNTINETNGKVVFSVENAKQFLNSFNYIDLSNTKISIRGYNYCENQIAKYNFDGLEEPYCYKIENLVIGNNLQLDMFLSPTNYNNIYGFSINGDKNINKGSYKLDDEKIIWNENYKRNSGSTEIDKYDFKNFFLYIFNPPKSETNTTIIDNNTNTIEESDIVKIFKRTKLLGANGDFQTIKGFLDISYNDIIVKENLNDYDIFIKKGTIYYENLNAKYKTIISSKYNFLNKYPEHSFINPEFLFYNQFDNQLYNGNLIKIIGNFKISTFKNDFTSMLLNFNNINEILIKIDNSLGIKKVDITYNYSDNNYIFKIDDINLEIKIRGIAVNSVLYNGKEQLKEKISIYDLEKTLKLIK